MGGRNAKAKTQFNLPYGYLPFTMFKPVTVKSTGVQNYNQYANFPLAIALTRTPLSIGMGVGTGTLKLTDSAGKKHKINW